MFIKFVINILFLISIPLQHSAGADYGLHLYNQELQNYRLNADVKSYPVRSPDELFGFEVSPNVVQSMRISSNTKDNKQNQNNVINDNNYDLDNDYDDYLDQNNVLREPMPQIMKAQKNRLKTSSYLKPLAAKPKKMIFSQYLSPHLLESEDSYSLSPTNTFEDQYLAQLMPQLMSTAEEVALKHEEEVTQYEHPVIPASQLLEYLRSSIFAISDDPYGAKHFDSY